MDELRCALEWRADDSRASPGRLIGTLIQYETRAVDRAEVFKAGALEWPDDGVILNLSHDRKQPLIRFIPTVAENRVMVDLHLPDTSRGRDAAVMVRNGTLRGLSVEFRALAEGRRGELREVTRASLHGAALVDDPAYAGGVEVRDRGPGRKPGRATLWL